MTDTLGALATVFNRKHTIVSDQVDGPQEGTILSVDTGAFRAVVVMSESSFSDGTRFGPLPYCRCDVAYAPQVGDKCLVQFVGKGIDRGWVTSWTPPA
jgi:hypothetical protein